MTQSEWVKINAQRPELNLVAVPLEWAATESNGGKGGLCKGAVCRKIKQTRG